MNYLKDNDNSLIITLKVLPGASKNELFVSEGILKIRITAPPVDNKANKFVVSYLSKQFRIPKSSIEIIKGELSRDKVIKMYIDDIDKKEAVKNILKAL